VFLLQDCEIQCCKRYAMKRTLFFFSLLVALGCSAPNEEEFPDAQRMDFGAFSMKVPTGWTYKPQMGIDSLVGIIEANVAEKISFDCGMYSNNLNVDESKHNISYMIIDGKGAKVVKPKISGQGFTGVYFENVKTGTSVRLVMSGINFTPATEEALLSSIKTLHFN
jgi:hypothetical protein